VTKLKVGDKSYTAVYGAHAKIEFWEYELRTIRTHRGFRYGYWWNKLKGVTWGKVSKRHFDYGWLPGSWVGWRVQHPIDAGRPYSASKIGAVAVELADVRRLISEYGENCDFNEEGYTLRDQLNSLIRVQKRLRSSK